MSYQVLHGDALEVLRGMESESVHCGITSPPYWGGLRDYGVDRQIGLEVTPEEYVARLIKVFREFKRVLRKDGTLWVNLGDAYAGSNQGRGTKYLSAKQASNTGTQWMVGQEIRRLPEGLKPLDLCGIPGDVVRALRADGWYWRQTIIWNKPNPMPESMQGWRWEQHMVQVEGGKRGRERQRVGAHPDRPQQDHNGRDFQPSTKWIKCPGCEKCLPHGGLMLRKGSWRPTTSHEYIFMLSKTDTYFCDPEAVREVYTESTIQRISQPTFDRQTGGPRDYSRGTNPDRSARQALENLATHPESGRNLRSVWTFPAGQADWEYCDKCGMLYTGPNRRSIQIIPDPDDPAPDDEKKKRVRLCPKCKATKHWVDHFAAFPLELPRKCIMAGTSEKGVCKKCSAPWVRVVEVSYRNDTTITGRPAVGNRVRSQGKEDEVMGYAERTRRISKTLDWLPSCDCDAGDPVPPVVVDFFCGSGQTGIAALKLGRSFIGIDLKREYCDVTNARLKELTSQQRLI